MTDADPASPLLTPRLRGLFGAMEQALSQDLGLDPRQVDALLHALEAAVVERAVRLPRGGGLTDAQVGRIEAHVEAALDGTIRVQDLARLLRLSTGGFTRAFRIRFGLPPRAWIIRRRVERAKRMLGTSESLTRIALDCGFCDQPHFTNHFRRVTGATPNAWRRERLAAG